MSHRVKPMLKVLAVVFAAGLFYVTVGGSPLSVSSFAEKVVTPFGESAQNPCNPCSKKKAQNPCNPCAKKAQNPCNPCNPCGGKMKATGKIYQDAASYKDWSKLTTLMHSAGHGGKYVITYGNKTAETAIGKKQFPFKSGAKFIKEGYDDAQGHTLSTLYVMEKRGSQWYYAMTDPKGGIQMEGIGNGAQMCNSCHAGAQHDFAFVAGGSTGKMPNNPCNPCAKKKKP